MLIKRTKVQHDLYNAECGSMKLTSRENPFELHVMFESHGFLSFFSVAFFNRVIWKLELFYYMELLSLIAWREILQILKAEISQMKVCYMSNIWQSNLSKPKGLVGNMSNVTNLSTTNFSYLLFLPYFPFLEDSYTYPAILWLHSSQRYNGGGLSPRATDREGSIHIWNTWKGRMNSPVLFITSPVLRTQRFWLRQIFKSKVE